MSKHLKIKPYYCAKCSRPVELVFITGMGNGTWKVFNNMMNAELCRDCYCEGNVEGAAEKILEGVCIH